ncbi:MAG: histidine kinase dimerization/phosphoacceptor domain -containing protein [Lentisphaerota bacterium]
MEQRQKILVVDDTPISVALNVTLLHEVNADIVIATSGEEAIKKALAEDFDLILMDVVMKGIDGFQAIEAIKKEEKNRFIPVIFITALQGEEKQIIKGLNLGAVDFIIKPISKEILYLKAKNLLEVQRNRKALAIRECELQTVINDLSASRLATMNMMEESVEARKLTDEAKEQVQSLLKEKEILLTEVHHRIKNNMQLVSGMLMMQAASMKDDLAVKAMEDAQHRIYTMSVLYDKLYRSDNFSEISIKGYFENLVDEIFHSLPDSKHISIEKHIEDIIISARISFSLGIIVNEIMTNIAKYAFKGRDKGKVTISASMKEGKVVLVIQDDGIGIPENVNVKESSGFGLKLLDMMTQQIKGTINIERVNGTKFILEFPNTKN